MTAVSVYEVVVVGATTNELPVTSPMPLLSDVVLALFTVQLRVVLLPATIEVGSAVNATIVGTAAGTVALQVVVATVDDASVP